MNTRVREQLEGALQVALVGFVLAVAVVGSHIYPWNTPSVRPVRTFALVEFMALAVAYAVIARARLRLLPGVVVVGALTVVALLSTAWSVSPGLTVERGLGFAALIAAGAALALTAVDRPRLAGYLLLAVLAATVLVALGGLVELWHAYEHAVLPATRGQAARYNGIGQNPNQIAMLIALTLPIALWAAGRSRGWARVAAWGATLLLTGSLAASGSRGAVVAAFAGCLVYVVAAPRRRRILAAGVLTVAFVAVVGATRLPQPAEVNPPLYENFGRTPKLAPRDLNGGLPLDSEVGFPGENREAGIERTLFFSSGRAEAWGFAIEQGLRRPVVGYGFGTEDETFVDRTYLFVSDVVENSFIGMFLQLGAVGVALVVGALALVLAAWLGARRRLTPETADDAAACAGVVVAGVVLAVPQSYLTSVGSPPTAPFWLALCLLAALSYRRAAA